MRWTEAVRLAFESLRSQKLKSAFSLIGVLIGVTFLIAVVSVIEGMNRFMEDKFANQLIGVNAFQVRRFPNFNNGNVTSDTWREWTRRPRVNYREATRMRDGLAEGTLTARLCWDDGGRLTAGNLTATGIFVQAADEAYLRIKKYDIESGRTFTPQEVRLGMPVVVIGHLVGERLFPNRDPVGKQIVIHGLPHTIVGIVKPLGSLFGISLDKFAIIPFTSPAKSAFCRPNVVHEFWVQAKDAPAALVAQSRAEEIMRMARGLRPGQENNFAIQTAKGALGFWEKISGVLILALPMLVSISLVVGGIVIMNIMLMTVTERTREIGIRKALGARRQDILAQFVAESVAISVIGAAAGVALGIGLAFVVKALTPLPAAVAPWSIVFGVVLGVVVGVAAGVYPASRAARLDPITALRQE